MSAHACSARKISCAERIGNDNISIETPSWQNSGIFEILIAWLHFVEKMKAQTKTDKVAVFRKVSFEPPHSTKEILR